MTLAVGIHWNNTEVHYTLVLLPFLADEGRLHCVCLSIPIKAPGAHVDSMLLDAGMMLA